MNTNIGFNLLNPPLSRMGIVKEINRAMIQLLIK